MLPDRLFRKEQRRYQVQIQQSVLIPSPKPHTLCVFAAGWIQSKEDSRGWPARGEGMLPKRRRVPFPASLCPAGIGRILRMPLTA